MKKKFYLLILFLYCNKGFAQSVTIDPNPATNGSAIIKAKSTNAGTIIPNMTAAQRVAIASPLKGLLIFDTDSATFWFHNGSIWVELVANTPQWTPTNGNTNLFANYQFFTLGGGTNISGGSGGSDGTLRIYSPYSITNPSYLNLDATSMQARRFNIFSGAKTDTDLKLNPFGGNVGIGLNSIAPTANLHIGGNMKINGVNTLEFGAGVVGKNINAGKIGYQVFGNNNALDIVGAGNTIASRKINLWAEGGVYSPQTPNLNIVPLGIAELEAWENSNGLITGVVLNNITGNLVESGISSTIIQIDDYLNGRFRLRDDIVSQYSKIVAISSLNYYGGTEFPIAGTFINLSSVSGFIGEIGDRVIVSTGSGTGPVSSIPAGTYYSMFVVVDDFSLTGVSRLTSKVMFYGIK